MSPAWMPFYVEDYLSATGHLTTVEHGAYLLLIMRYWQKGELPSDERLIARIAKMTPDQWAESRDVLQMLFVDGWRHKRVDDELAKAGEIIGKRRAAADAMHAKRRADAVQVHDICSDTRVPPSPTPKETTDTSAREAKPLPQEPFVSKDEEGELFASAGKALSSSPNLLVMADPMKWKAAGMDWMLDVLPAIREAAKHAKPGRIQSWGYFTQAIADWHEQRCRPMPRGSPGNGATSKPSQAQAAVDVLERLKTGSKLSSSTEDFESGTTFEASDYRRTG